MKFVWKGKLNKDEGFPTTDLPANAKMFLGEEKSTSYIPIIIAILSFGIIVFKTKQRFVSDLLINPKSLWIGIALAVLFLIVHEIIHGLSCPKNCVVNYYYSIHGITAYPLSPMSRNRYIFMAMCPAIFLGFIPMIIWIFIPAKFVIINSIIFSFSWVSLSVSVADIYNSIKALKLPKNSLIQASGAKGYWFTNS